MKYKLLNSIKYFFGFRKRLTYKERVSWFVNNFYESGMEYSIMLKNLKSEDLDNFMWYGDIIKIPKYKDEISERRGENFLEYPTFKFTYKMETTNYDGLLTEAQDLATKTNALNDFMKTQKFVDLDRENKDLIYKQSRLMNEYLQILGQRIELLGEKFSLKK